MNIGQPAAETSFNSYSRSSFESAFLCVGRYEIWQLPLQFGDSLFVLQKQIGIKVHAKPIFADLHGRCQESRTVNGICDWCASDTPVTLYVLPLTVSV